jgi:hypothetical protein
MASVDPTFLKNICIRLFSDPLALKFKQSCTDSRPQNGQIEVQDSQTPDSEILDPESPDFLNSSSRIHISHKGERPRDDTDSRFMFMDGFLYYQGLLIYQMVHFDFEFSSPVMIFLLHDILASTKSWSLYRVISGGQKCGKP